MLAEYCSKCESGKKNICKKQFVNAKKNDKIYCPIDGSVLQINLEY